MFDKIKELLVEAETFVALKGSISLECSNAKDYILAMEFADEVEFLTALLAKEEQDFSNHFKKRCLKRAARNANSGLSFIANPTGACNQLYWKMTKLIFPELNTMGEMLAILQPAIKFIDVEPVRVDLTKKLSIQNTNFCFQEVPISELKTKADVDDLANFVTYKSLVFDVRQIANFNFSLHRIFNQTFEQYYPALVTRLYEHNPALAVLYERLWLIGGLGDTPREVISTVIAYFNIGSETTTGAFYATAGANHAFHKRLISYVEALPSPFKENLLAAKNRRGISLQDVLNELYAGGCVETASSDLQSILDNPEKKDILDSYPLPAIKELNQQYKTPLETIKENEIQEVLPTYYVEQILSHLEIRTIEDFLTLVMICPPELYASLLEEVQIFLPLSFNVYVSLLIAMDERQQQQVIFEEAVFKNKEKLGISNVLNFTISSTKLFHQILQSVEEEKCLDVLSRLNSEGNCTLHDAIGFPETLELIRQKLPADEFTKVFFVLNQRKDTVLHLAVRQKVSLEILLKSLSQHYSFDIIKQKNLYGDTVLHEAAFDRQALSMILQAIPENERLQAIKEKNGQGKTLVSLLQHNKPCLEVVLQALSKECSSEKIKLFLILEQIITNIERATDRKTSGFGSHKVSRLSELQEQLLQKDANDREFSSYIKEALAICHIKRHPLHFWAEPKSVNEFLSLAAKENLPGFDVSTARFQVSL
ncbi:hypothetical protein [Legionella hackeliae]|uniref:Ankyrin repeat protein n=1 Tax=Legionella hackeliae TaxID=449 RepID=A0A0A8UR21_LEGHA|nr:hypothetical protein [Legionella hackeliae]KTD12896.1 hypothetical protein Lhac_1767 [Legionella hackeliae]CEK09204.1 protein of unknown function [Legionella hackeliae]STX49112.1 Uncharacterised protein [Legionella hackeliae]